MIPLEWFFFGLSILSFVVAVGYWAGHFITRITKL